VVTALTKLADVVQRTFGDGPRRPSSGGLSAVALSRIDVLASMDLEVQSHKSFFDAKY
jgi:hypothetical protein